MLRDSLVPGTNEPDGRAPSADVHRTAFLHEVSSIAISSLDAHGIVRHVADVLHARTGAAITAVRLANRERSRLHLIASHGLAEGYVRERGVIAVDEDHPVPHVFSTGEPTWSTDPRSSASASAIAEDLSRWGAEPRTLLVLPLKGAASTVGVLTLGWTDDRGLDDADIDFFASVANILAVGVENAFLYEDARDAAETAKRLSAASERLAAEFGGIFESLTDAVIVLDSSGTAVRANDPARHLLGFDPHGLDHWELMERLDARDRSGSPLRRAETAAARALKGETTRRDAIAVTHDGSEVHLVTSASPLVSGGVVSGAVLVMHDVTEREKLVASLARERKRVEDILTSITDGFAVIDRSGVYRYVNHALASMVGKQVDEIAGRYVWDVFPEARGTEFERAINAVLNEGTALSFEQHYPPTDLWVDVRMYPSDSGVSIFASDVTDRHKADEDRERLLAAYELEIARTALLKDTSSAAGTSLSAERICERVLDTVRDRLGPLRGAVHLFDPDSDALVLSASFGYPDASVAEIRRVPRTSNTPPALLVREGLALITHETVPPSPAAREHDGEEDVRWLVLPVPFAGHVLGTFGLTFQGRRPFTEDEVSVFRTITAQLGIALDNARLYQREHRIAETLQQSLLSDPTRVEALEIGRVYRSATENVRVGGDFYDVYGVADDAIAVAIGDVSGKGLVAARVTALVRNGMRAHVLDHHQPHEVLERVNDLLWHFSDSETFASVALGLLDPGSGRFLYCNGGHPAPLLLRADGTVERLAACGPVLGAFRSVTYSLRSTTVGDGDTLVLYTDGVVEARNDSGFFGEDRLADLLAGLAGRSAEDVAQEISRATWEYCGGRLRDDIAVLAIGSLRGSAAR